MTLFYWFHNWTAYITNRAAKVKDWNLNLQLSCGLTVWMSHTCLTPWLTMQSKMKINTVYNACNNWSCLENELLKNSLAPTISTKLSKQFCLIICNTISGLCGSSSVSWLLSSDCNTASQAGCHISLSSGPSLNRPPVREWIQHRWSSRNLDSL